MTPAEVSRWRAGFHWRAEQAERGRIRAAWITAGLIRSRKMPTLAEVLGERRTRTLTEAERAARQAEFDELARRMAPAITRTR
jgi:hypothetical protein